MTTWDELKDEYDEHTVGERWLDEVTRSVRAIAPKYPASVYSETGHWNPEALENLVQEVVVSQLLAEGQLEYILDTATDLTSARGRLGGVVKRTLAKTRQRTVVDNLLDRAQELRPFAAPGTAPDSNYADVYRAATQVAKLPRIRIIHSERAPRVFATGILQDALDMTAAALDRPATRSEFARILELTLTDYVPSRLVQTDGGADEPDRAFTPEEEVAVQDTLNRLSELPADILTILALKIDGNSDEVIAQRLGVSRPTAAKRSRQASETVERALEALEYRHQNDVLTRFAQKLMTEHLPDGTDGGNQ